MKTAREWFNEPEREWAEIGCEACALLPDGDMTEEQAKTATLCGDCEAYFGIGEPEFCARCLQFDEACKCYASIREGVK
jgi:hypothetical protein